jgi:hypothetical protein
LLLPCLPQFTAQTEEAEEVADQAEEDFGDDEPASTVSVAAGVQPGSGLWRLARAHALQALSGPLHTSNVMV